MEIRIWGYICNMLALCCYIRYNYRRSRALWRGRALRIYDKPWYVSLQKASDRTSDWYPLPKSMPSKRIEVE